MSWIVRLARRGASTGDAGLMEQAGGAGGDQPSGPGADEVVRLCGACGSGLVSQALGRLRDPPLGHYDPCARCSLTARPDRRDTQARTGAESPVKAGGESRSRTPRGAPGPRHGLGPSPAIRRWARPRGAPRVRRSAPAPVGALLPSFFRGAEEDKGHPAPSVKPGSEALASVMGLKESIP